MHVRTNSTVNDGTYIAFIILMAVGAVLALFLANAKDVIRDDGSRVVLMKNPTWSSEFMGLYETFKFEPMVVLLFPMFFSSNWFYTYQQNAVNGSHFDTRTKALNSCLYYLAQIFGALILGYALDIESVSRSVRARMCLVMLFASTMVIWGGGYAFQKQYTRADVGTADWTSSEYVGPMFLYIFYGLFDSLWQCSVYW
jgi:H+/Cl- antiporter ClcA